MTPRIRLIKTDRCVSLAPEGGAAPRVTRNRRPIERADCRPRAAEAALARRIVAAPILPAAWSLA